MKIVMDISLVDQSSGRKLGTLRKQLESEVMPALGLKVEDGAWAEPRSPVKIVANLAKSSVHLTFADVEGADESECIRIAELYQGHGWRRPSEWEAYVV